MHKIKQIGQKKIDKLTQHVSKVRLGLSIIETIEEYYKNDKVLVRGVEVIRLWTEGGASNQACEKEADLVEKDSTVQLAIIKNIINQVLLAASDEIEATSHIAQAETFAMNIEQITITAKKQLLFNAIRNAFSLEEIMAQEKVIEREIKIGESYSELLADDKKQEASFEEEILGRKKR